MRSATRLFADRKLFAVFAVALMLFSTVAVVSNLLQVSEADYVGDQYVVTYDVGDIPIGNWQYNKINENASVSVTYYGTPIAEYNPQYWDGNITGSVSGNPGNWNAITCYVNDETLVFTGWSETKGGESGEIDPGDVLEFENGVKTKTLYACWGTLLEYKSVSGANTTADFVKYDKYRYVLGINGNVKLGGPNDSSTIGGCTVVSAGPDGYPAKSKFDYYNQDSLKIDGELIVENITMMGHGATTTQDVNGYYARGNQIIIGANVSCEGNVQIYGGWKSASDQSSEGPAYTDVRIFSGKYSNVIGGSSDNIEVSITKTNVLIAGTTSVVESVIGGSIGKRGSNSTKLVEQTNILIVSGNVDTNGYKDVSKTQIRGDMSTVIGGSRYGYVGTTNVEVSGDASVFAVQGGGRQASSKADTTNVTISGQAHIIHMVCGSVTDGNPTDPTDPTEDHFPVGDSHISVRDSPQIGNVYGGGWDIWQKPDGPSTRTTDVDIRGNPTIGGVYGGGFRGTVGDGGLTVSITVAGGNIDAVYGGGSGGEDPVINANNGNKGPGAGNKTGPAEVNGDVSILITGGEVGEVYGGGQGAPDGNTYCGSVTGDITISVTEGAVIHGDIYGGGYGVPDNPSVASASGTVNIAILGGSVGGSVYGGGNLGYIQGDIKISILGGKVSGNVFGGGNGQDGGNGSAKVYGSVNITVGGSGVEGPGIGGSVFGGGNGVQIKDSGDVSESVAVLEAESISIDIESGTIGGSVYGGGNYGKVERSTQPTIIDIDLGECKILGSVFGGGYGEEGRLAVYSGVRTITIDGAEISKSVYGGSRYGDDNYDNNLNKDTKAESNILFVSGNLTVGSAGNIYGGGYMAHSYMDANIFVGYPAMVEAEVDVPAVSTLLADSVIGGASVGSSSTNYFDKVLLDGNTSISIGLPEQETDNPYTVWGISGDVFGSGDYCLIGGTSEVTFTNYHQDGDMLSIQKVDRLTLVNSSLSISGNVDATTSSGTVRMSLNRIKHLILRGTSDGTQHSELKLSAAAGSIAGYSSWYAEDSVGTAPFDKGDYNSITMYDGLIFSITGIDNTKSGEDVTVIEGETLFKSDSGDSYYGAFAIGANADDPSVMKDPRFFVQDSETRGYIEAQFSDYKYSGGSTFRAWYITGAYKVEGMMVIHDSADGSGISSSLDVTLPKVNNNSVISYVGYYTNPYTPGSMNLVASSENLQTPGSDLLVTVGGNYGAGYTVFGDTGLVLHDGTRYTAENATSSGLVLRVDFQTKCGFSNTGYIGTITIHMVERVGTIAINAFDVEIGVYLRLAAQAPGDQTTEETIEHETTVYDDGITISGETDVYLPFLEDNMMGEYYLIGADIPGDDSTLRLVTRATNVGKSGWTTSEYYNSVLNVVNGGYKPGETITDRTLLGVGGVFSPVIGLEYEAPSILKNDKVTLYVALYEEGNSGGRPVAIFTIVLTPTIPEPVKVTFYDTDLLSDGVLSWKDPYELFSIEVVYRDHLDQYYVAVETGFYSGTWSPGTSEFAKAVKSVLHTDTDGKVVSGTSSYMHDLKLGTDWKIVPIAHGLTDSFLDQIVKNKPEGPAVNDLNTGQSKPFDYSSNYGWYSSPEASREYNFGSETTEDVNIYASYSIKLSFEIVNEDRGDGMYVQPPSYLPGIPGTAVNLNDIGQTLTVTPGYKIVGWYSSPDKDRDNLLNGNGEYRCYTSGTLYIDLEPIPLYIDSIAVNDGTKDLEVELKVLIAGAEAHPDETNGYEFHFRDQISISFTLNGSFENLHPFALSDSNLLGVSMTSDGNGTWTVTFNGPQYPIDELKIYVRSEYNITVELADSGNNDNDSFSLSKSENGVSIGNIPETGQQNTISILADGDSVISSEDLKFSGNNVTFTVYRNGELVGEAYTDSLSLKNVQEGDRFVVHVTVEWQLALDDGKGYSVDVKKLMDPNGSYGEEVSLVKDMTFHTGDTLILKASEDYRFDNTFSASGIRYELDPFEIACTVDGTDNIVLGDATLLEINVTISVEFATQIPNDHGYVTVTDLTGTSWNLSDSEVIGDNLKFAAALEEGRYSFTIHTPGFHSYSTGYMTVYDGMIVTMYAVKELEGYPNEGGDGHAFLVVGESVEGTYAADHELVIDSSFEVGGSEFTIKSGGGTVTITKTDGGQVRLSGVYVVDLQGFGTLTLVAVPDVAGAGGAVIVPA